jgi:hypothetical protein
MNTNLYCHAASIQALADNRCAPGSDNPSSMVHPFLSVVHQLIRSAKGAKIKDFFAPLRVFCVLRETALRARALSFRAFLLHVLPHRGDAAGTAFLGPFLKSLRCFFEIGEQVWLMKRLPKLWQQAL